jgi:phosphoribosylaminoimidazolecarboxamide formyltransferase/IMP cyclohydrolase
MLNTVYQVPDLVRIQTALVSVTDKTNLDFLVKNLFELNPNLVIYSTGGTLNQLNQFFPDRSAHIKTVESLTGNPEIQGGLVKTLDYKIYLGLLTEPYNPEHRKALEANRAPVIDLVVVNLYPFVHVTQDPQVDLELARANIDIGGPTMIRAAAKNFHRVLVLTHPQQYLPVVEWLKNQQGQSSFTQRFEMARAAFHHIRQYDVAIDEFLSAQSPEALKAYSLKDA